MRILAGNDAPDAGDVRLHAGAKCGLLQQHPEFSGPHLFAEAKSGLDELLKAQEDMVRTADALAHATAESERKSPFRPLRPF